MNDLLTFDFDAQNVRIIVRDDVPWFVAADVASILGYSEAYDMTRNLDDDEKDTHIVRTLGGNQDMTIISESGLYNAIFKSRRAEAKAFRRWVTGTVLPQIRRTGGFGLRFAPSNEDANLNIPHWNAAVAVLREARQLFGHGVARALWPELGLPLPVCALPLPDDGLADAVALWAAMRDRFTSDDLAAGLGLGRPDTILRRRFADCLRGLGFESKRARVNGSLEYVWLRQTGSGQTVTGTEITA